jgi:AcrR family transcriptional regulator
MNYPQGVAEVPAASGPAGRIALHGEGDSRIRSDTRARIQQVAVELFTEHGYEGTSLREIAERLDVTKAALYYHFKSKEDIVISLIEDYSRQMDALIEWARQQPKTAQTRTEILSRYVDIVVEGDKVFRMLHQNQAAVNTLSAGKSRGELFKERIEVLIDLLTEPGAALPERVRAAMALGGISVSWMFFGGKGDRNEVIEAIRRIASEVTEMPCAPDAGRNGHGDRAVG